jgi:ArsR family transcriptional regulator, arsenate/arsenite/antimonite-responsive transcriptional repressor
LNAQRHRAANQQNGRCARLSNDGIPHARGLRLTIQFSTEYLTEYDSLFSEIPKENAMNAVFQALSDPTRREVLRLLRERDMTAGEITDRFPLSRSTLSGHFNVLKHAGLIVAEKNGTSILYSLNVSVVEQALAAMLELLDVVKPAKEPSPSGSKNPRLPRKRNHESSVAR